MHHLVYRDELGSMRTVPLDGSRPVTIGRDNERDLVLQDRQVSRHHASIETVSGSFLLRDTGSVNGTFLNGLRLSGASAITLRAGDVIEIGHLRICFANDLERAEESLVPVPPREFQETVFTYQDLLRDGLTIMGTTLPTGKEPDESSAHQVLTAFLDAPVPTALKRTLEVLDRKLDVDTAAVFLKRRSGALEIMATRPSTLDVRSIAHELDARCIREQPILLYRKADERYAASMTDTYVGAREHSAALVPFFRGAGLLGVILVERFTGTRLDRKDASIAAVYGERIARALSVRGGSPNDTPVGVLGDVA